MADLTLDGAASEADVAGMVPDLAVSPAGRAYLDGDDTAASAAAKRIAKAFERSCLAASTSKHLGS